MEHESEYCSWVYTIKENAAVLIVTSMEMGLEVNADKTKYMDNLEIRMEDEVTI
jgi:hypothetical protein